jgi:hypothetical protein
LTNSGDCQPIHRTSVEPNTVAITSYDRPDMESTVDHSVEEIKTCEDVDFLAESTIVKIRGYICGVLGTPQSGSGQQVLFKQKQIKTPKSKQKKSASKSREKSSKEEIDDHDDGIASLISGVKCAIEDFEDDDATIVDSINLSEEDDEEEEDEEGEASSGDDDFVVNNTDSEHDEKPENSDTDSEEESDEENYSSDVKISDDPVGTLEHDKKPENGDTDLSPSKKRKLGTANDGETSASPSVKKQKEQEVAMKPAAPVAVEEEEDEECSPEMYQLYKEA